MYHKYKVLVNGELLKNNCTRKPLKVNHFRVNKKACLSVCLRVTNISIDVLCITFTTQVIIIS